MNAAEQLSRWRRILLGYGWKAGWNTSSACLAVADEIAAALNAPVASCTGDEAPTAAARDVLAERARQVSVEGYTSAHDDQDGYGELARAAACYALGKKSLRALEWSPDIILWPWENAAWKYDNPRRSLVKAGAMALAAIECIDRTGKGDVSPWDHQWTIGSEPATHAPSSAVVASSDVAKMVERKIPPNTPAPRGWTHIFADGEAKGWNDCLDAIDALGAAATQASAALATRAKAPSAVQATREPWVPYLSDRADGVRGHYAICRMHPAGYREAWNLRSHRWASASDDVLSIDEASALLKEIIIPTRIPAPSAATGEVAAWRAQEAQEKKL